MARPTSWLDRAIGFAAGWIGIPRSASAPPPPISEGRRQDAPPPPATDTDRALVAAMLEGVVAQVQAEQALHDGTYTQPPAVRLVPQVPIRDQATPRSWLGGRPRMPAETAWPEAEGSPCDFIAQIALADLPADLWSGQGPRQGWLALFLHPQTYVPRLLHIPEPGPARESPSPPAEVDGWFHPYGWRRGDELQARYMRRAWPEWPVDVVPAPPGDPEDGHEAAGRPGRDLYEAGFDLADAAHHPFDWPSMLALVDSALAALENLYSREVPSPSPLETQLASFEERLAAGGPPPGPDGAPVVPYTPERRTEMELRAQGLRELIPASAEARVMGRAALEAVRCIAGEVHAAAAERPFTRDLAQELVAALHGIRWKKVIRKKDPQGRPGAELIEAPVLPITTHTRDGSLFAWTYHILHYDMARHAYCRDTASLPAASRAFYEPLWHATGKAAAPQLGGFPQRYVHAFDPKIDVVVLEIPSNQLMGWMFGDVDDIVLTLKRGQIAEGRFADVAMNVSN